MTQFFNAIYSFFVSVGDFFEAIYAVLSDAADFIVLFTSTVTDVLLGWSYFPVAVSSLIVLAIGVLIVLRVVGRE